MSPFGFIVKLSRYSGMLFQLRCKTLNLYITCYYPFISFLKYRFKKLMGRVSCFQIWDMGYDISYINTGTSLRERTAQNARSFNLSDRFERCANSFF
jgi:hypothetical protein